MGNKEFTYEQMGELIDKGNAKVIQKSQKTDGNGNYRYLIEYMNTQYLTCGCCGKYLLLDSFTNIKRTSLANKHTYCKTCRNKKDKESYNNDFSRHLHSRYTSIIQKSKIYKVPYLSFEEFIKFSKTVKEPIYQITLEESFYKNISADFEIDHIIPISKGGESLLYNLTLTCTPFNRLKGIMTLDETIAFAKLIVKHEQDIKNTYDKK